MRRTLGYLISAILVASLLLSACSSAAPAPAKPAAAPAESKPAAAPAESKPAAAKPAEAKPADKPAETKAAQAKGPIKIGYLTPLTGTLSGQGKDLRDGFLLYLEQHKNQIGGRNVEVIVEDTEAKPDVGLTKAKKLVERDNVQILAGIISSGVAYGIAEYVKGQKVPLFILNAGADDLTQAKASPYIFRNSFSNSQNTHLLGEWAYKKGYRKAAIVSADYAAGYEYSGGFARTFIESGGQIVQELYYPMGSADYSPFITAVKPDVDLVYSFSVGADAMRFVKAYDGYGLKKRAALLGPGALTDPSVLAEQGDSAVGVITTANYTEALDTPANKAFVDAFRKAFNRTPNYTGEHGYVGGMMLDKALQSIGGNMEDKEAFIKALEKVEFADAPRGPIKFDKYHNVINNIYAIEVKKVNGQLTHVVADTYKDVTQFWKWSPEEYMKMPLYTDLKGKWAK